MIFSGHQKTRSDGAGSSYRTCFYNYSKGLDRSTANPLLMTMLRAALTWVLITVGFAAGTASAEPRFPGELAAVTRLSGRGAGVVRVSIPERAKLLNPLVKPSRLQVAGRGQFTGFALIRAHPDDRGFGWVGGTLRVKGASVPFVVPAAFGLAETRTNTKSYAVPPGDYLLYLLGEGRSSVTIPFEGLDGQVSLSTSQPVDYEVRTPEVRLSVEGTYNFYTAGSTAELSSQGMLFGLLWYRTQAHLISRITHCFNDGDPPAEYEDLYVDSGGHGDCAIPNAGKAQEYTTRAGGVSTGAGSHFYYGTAAPWEMGFEDGGKWSQVQKIKSAALIEEVKALQLWLSYHPSAAGGR